MRKAAQRQRRGYRRYAVIRTNLRSSDTPIHSTRKHQSTSKAPASNPSSPLQDEGNTGGAETLIEAVAEVGLDLALPSVIAAHQHNVTKRWTRLDHVFISDHSLDTHFMRCTGTMARNKHRPFPNNHNAGPCINRNDPDRDPQLP
jgi:hypothetical protein